MAYAPYTNDYRTEHQPQIFGQFREAEEKNVFEFTERNTDYEWRNGWLSDDFPHLVYVGEAGQSSIGSTTRIARVCKTVAYIVVDEDADGNPVVEKWKIKNRKNYA